MVLYFKFTFKSASHPLTTIVRIATTYTDSFLFFSGMFVSLNMTHELTVKGEIRWFKRLVSRYVRCVSWWKKMLNEFQIIIILIKEMKNRCSSSFRLSDLPRLCWQSCFITRTWWNTLGRARNGTSWWKMPIFVKEPVGWICCTRSSFYPSRIRWKKFYFVSRQIYIYRNCIYNLSTVRVPYVSVVRGHAIVTVGTTVGIRAKFLANAWDTSRVVHRLVVHDISLHDTDEEQRCHDHSSRFLVSSRFDISREREREREEYL